MVYIQPAAATRTCVTGHVLGGNTLPKNGGVGVACRNCRRETARRENHERVTPTGRAGPLASPGRMASTSACARARPPIDSNHPPSEFEEVFILGQQSNDLTAQTRHLRQHAYLSTYVTITVTRSPSGTSTRGCRMSCAASGTTRGTFTPERGVTGARASPAAPHAHTRHVHGAREPRPRARRVARPQEAGRVHGREHLRARPRLLEHESL